MTRGEVGEGIGRIVERAWWGVLQETWCQAREYASLVWRYIVRIAIESSD